MKKIVLKGEELRQSIVNAVNEFCDKYNLSINSLSDDGLPSFLIKLKK